MKTNIGRNNNKRQIERQQMSDETTINVKWNETIIERNSDENGLDVKQKWVECRTEVGRMSNKSRLDVNYNNRQL
jgi:hypothetical protein